MRVAWVRSQSEWDCHRIHLADCAHLTRAKAPKLYDVEGATIPEIERAVDEERYGPGWSTGRHLSVVAGCCEKRMTRIIEKGSA